MVSVLRELEDTDKLAKDIVKKLKDEGTLWHKLGKSKLPGDKCIITLRKTDATLAKPQEGLSCTGAAEVLSTRGS